MEYSCQSQQVSFSVRLSCEARTGDTNPVLRWTNIQFLVETLLEDGLDIGKNEGIAGVVPCVELSSLNGPAEDVVEFCRIGQPQCLFKEESCKYKNFTVLAGTRQVRRTLSPTRYPFSFSGAVELVIQSTRNGSFASGMTSGLNCSLNVDAAVAAFMVTRSL